MYFYLIIYYLRLLYIYIFEVIRKINSTLLKEIVFNLYVLNLKADFRTEDEIFVR